jgi:hypothetical protein
MLVIQGADLQLFHLWAERNEQYEPHTALVGLKDLQELEQDRAQQWGIAERNGLDLCIGHQQWFPVARFWKRNKSRATSLQVGISDVTLLLV